MTSRLELNMRLGAFSLPSGANAPERIKDFGRESEIAHANKQFSVMEQVLDRMQAIYQNQKESRLGGVMIVAHENDLSFSLMRPVGEIVDDPNRTALEKRDKYTDFALGKYRALIAHPKFTGSSENLSLSGRNQVKVKGQPMPGGAIRFKDGSICVFSGFGTPEEDESVVLAMKVMIGDITKDESLQIARSLGNNVYVTNIDYLIGLGKATPMTMREEQRAGRKFGDSSLTGENNTALELFYKLIEAKDYNALATILGWSEGCPVVPEVIARSNAKAATEGYAELQFIRGNVLSFAKAKHPRLYRELIATHHRQAGEDVGQYDPMHTPSNHEDYIRGNASATGYAIPRLLREFIGPRDTAQRNQKRILQSLDILEKTMQQLKENKSADLVEFAVLLAENLANKDKAGIQENSHKYIRRLLSAGKLLEDNQHEEYQEIIGQMQKQNGKLWRIYRSSDHETLKAKGIALIKHD